MLDQDNLKYKYVCITCGGSDLVHDTTSLWNTETQTMDFIDTYSHDPFCRTCDNEVKANTVYFAPDVTGFVSLELSPVMQDEYGECAVITDASLVKDASFWTIYGRSSEGVAESLGDFYHWQAKEVANAWSSDAQLPLTITAPI